MGSLLAFTHEVSRSDVEVAWATYRALILAEVDDPSLQDDLTHQLAIAQARATHARLYNQWCHQ